MPTITLEIPLELIGAISAEALDSQREFEDVIISTLMVALTPGATGPTNYEKELATAVARCRALEPGSLFSLNADLVGSRRLFSREEWRVMTANPSFRPTVFGKSFGRAIADEGLAAKAEGDEGLKLNNGKTSDNKQIYKRSELTAKEFS